MVNTEVEKTLYDEVLADVEKKFKQYYSVNSQNYPVQEEYINKSAPINGVML